ncbi:hypothetical protein [Ralstonia pseudosolanacearum]|uniref:hypothetical protein n=1 Tax=Ralstonia pseudosolanacearum TaxID=1310165 RepID=UPI0013154417|nr:hypothetical protein [Ralstonia pseudosolanacearum]QWF10336.1 hypothetical protein KME70_09720 [Ralstonia solanacearum]
MTMQRHTLNEAADQMGAASTLLARYRSLFVSAGSLQAPAIEHAIHDLRRTASELEVLSITLAQAQRGNT